jgi:hypothetical protein
VYCLVNINYYLNTISAPEAMLKVWEGGLSLCGALAGVVLAGVIGAKLTRTPVGMTLYACLPILYALTVIAAVACMVVNAGYGPELPASFFTIEIGGVPRLFTAWLRIIIPAAVMLIVAPHAKKSALPAGHRFAVYAFLYGSVMILMESLREDGHMVWGFVHAEMVFDLVFALAALLYLAKTKKRILLCLLATAVLAGAVVALEFALDRSSIGDGLLYAAYIAVLGGRWNACRAADVNLRFDGRRRDEAGNHYIHDNAFSLLMSRSGGERPSLFDTLSSQLVNKAGKHSPSGAAATGSRPQAPAGTTR